MKRLTMGTQDKSLWCYITVVKCCFNSIIPFLKEKRKAFGFLNLKYCYAINNAVSPY